MLSVCHTQEGPDMVCHFLQESEQARQEAAENLQRCYEEVADLQAQLAALASSCREAADAQTQHLDLNLRRCQAALCSIGAAVSEADLALQDCLFRHSQQGDGKADAESPVSCELADGGDCQIWVNPKEGNPEAVLAAAESLVGHVKQV